MRTVNCGQCGAPTELSGLAKDLCDSINKYRTNNGLPKLAYSALMKCDQCHEVDQEERRAKELEQAQKRMARRATQAEDEDAASVVGFTGGTGDQGKLF